MERLDAFMARANAAYYASHDPFADFTTAPEISQAFGEVLGLWAAVVWQSMGAPDPVLLVEAGPGRGTLMADALRAIARAVPTFRAALRLHLIETSPRLRAAQAAVLPEATWHDGLATLPVGSLILLANEFLDALPIRQFVRRDKVMMERFVENGQFVEQISDSTPGTLQDGALVERNEAAKDFVAAVAQRLTTEPGAALLLDYGPAESAPGDSLQTLREGKPADPLSEAGTADLTAHVDFAALAAVARDSGATVHGPLPQGMFLTRIGLMQRTGALARSQPPARAATMMAGAQRLVEPDRMGRLFKALAVSSPGIGTLPGFT
jgi:NADH dehydrogenase [ubiquinone] 1 alpha subcomplex assembly factor 7